MTLEEAATLLARDVQCVLLHIAKDDEGRFEPEPEWLEVYETVARIAHLQTDADYEELLDLAELVLWCTQDSAPTPDILRVRESAERLLQARPDREVCGGMTRRTGRQ